jgi:hypothetical protein
MPQNETLKRDMTEIAKVREKLADYLKSKAFDVNSKAKIKRDLRRYLAEIRNTTDRTLWDDDLR